MKKIITLIGILILVLLTACSAPGADDSLVSNEVQSADTVSSTQLIQVDAGANQPEQSGDTGSSTQLNENYAEALPVQTQLALGTVLLEDGELAVDSDQVGEILPLWRVVQSLTESGTAADAEITAVVNQIQDSMTAEQISAIAGMQLTQEALRSLVQDGTIAISADGVKGGANGQAQGGGQSGGGPLGGGGGGSLAGAQPNESQQATRQATQGGADSNLFGQAITSALIQVLETKQSS